MLNADWPGTHRYGYVRPQFVQGLSAAMGPLIPCAIFGICSVPGRALTFHVLLENGAQYARVPLHGLTHREQIDQPLPLPALQAWDCFGYDMAVHRYAYLAERDVEVRLSEPCASQTMVGQYCCTVDWYDNGYSDTPDQHKCAHIIALENGQFAAMPNNRLRWYDASFTDWRLPIRLSVNTRIHYAERLGLRSPKHTSHEDEHGKDSRMAAQGRTEPEGRIERLGESVI